MCSLPNINSGVTHKWQMVDCSLVLVQITLQGLIFQNLFNLARANKDLWANWRKNKRTVINNIDSHLWIRSLEVHFGEKKRESFDKKHFVMTSVTCFCLDAFLPCLFQVQTKMTKAVLSKERRGKRHPLLGRRWRKLLIFWRDSVINKINFMESWH